MLTLLNSFNQQSKEAQELELAASDLEKFSFAYTKSPELFELYGVQPPAVLFFST
jgi:hypothetical protein